MFKNKSLILLVSLIILDLTGFQNLSGLAHADLTTGLIADYRFQNTFVSSVGNVPDLTVLGAGINEFAVETVDGNNHTVFTFQERNGLSLAPTINVITNNTYTIVFLVRLATVSGYRKYVDFKNGLSDNGLYNYSGYLKFYPIVSGSTTPITVNNYQQIVITRDGYTGEVVGYVDGVQQFSFIDTNGYAIISTDNTLRFFIDDGTNGGEASAGAVARIRIFNNVLTPTEVATLDRTANLIAAPTVVTNAPSVITSTNARFSGTVTPNGAATTASFDYGLTTSYGKNVTATPASIAATAAATAVSATVTGLTCNTQYHYRVKATNSTGTGLGADKTFTTNQTPCATQLTNGEALTNQTLNLGEWKYFYLTVPSGATNLTFTTTGSGDVDIYTQLNTLPDNANFTCISDVWDTSAETCEQQNPAAGTWWLGVFAYADSTYNVTGSFFKPQPQTISAITANPATLFVGDTATVSATASSNLPVAFTSLTTSVCSASGDNGATVTALTAGTCTIAANQAGDANYLAAVQVTKNISVSKKSQTITIDPPATSLFVGGTVTVSASTSSGLTVTFTSLTTSVCSATGTNGATITGLAVGTCNIAANQAGDNVYSAATQVTKTIAVTKKSQTITLTCNANAINFGNTATCNASSDSGLAVTVVATPASVCSFNTNTVTTVAIGTCTITATQAGDANYTAATPATTTIDIAKANQTITLTCNPLNLAVNAQASCNATATSGLPVSLSSATSSICTLSNTSVTNPGTGNVTTTTVTGLTAGTCTIGGKQIGNANYNLAPPATKNITIGTVLPPVNGACGSANGGTFSTKPVTNLCSSGTASTVAGTGPWTWNCAGSNGGTTANCSANLQTVVNAWLNPPTPTIIVEKPFILNVYANSNSLTLGSYDFLIKYESSKLIINYTQSAADCNREAVCSGPDGWSNYSVTNSPSSVVENGITYGTIRIKGSDYTTGAGPGSSLNLLKVYFKTQATPGTTIVNLTINELLSIQNNAIGAQNSAGGNSIIKISPGLCGDADGNNAVNIVDALAVARKVVGLPAPPKVNELLADVNVITDGVSIVDAMHIARYSVGLVTPPEVCKIGMPM